MMRFLLFFLILSNTAFSQSQLISKRISVSTSKTTFLIFTKADKVTPDSIQYFDVGSQDVMLKRTDLGNIVKLKAVQPGMDETNITLLTKGGQYYSLLVNFKENPDTLNYFFGSQVNEVRSEVKADTKMAVLNEQAQNVIIRSKKESTKNVKVRNMIGAGVKGLYFSEDRLFFHLTFFNSSAIPFDVDYLKFIVKARKKLSRASFQEYEISPIYTYGNFETIEAKSKLETFVVAFDKFTLDKDRVLSIELGEKNAGRSIDIELTNFEVLKAKAL